MFRGNFLSNLHCCSYYDQSSLLLKFVEHEPFKEVLYSLSGEMFENKVKLDCSNPFTNQYLYRIFGFGSINGIFCLHKWDEYDISKITLWNPATQEIKLIPPSLVVESVVSSIPSFIKDFVNLFGLSNVHGFGYDNVTDDYKIIRSVYFLCNINGPLEDSQANTFLDDFWEIYSLRSNSWRKYDVVDMPSSMYCIDGTQVYMDGVCHWLSQENCPSGICLVSFNLSNEKFAITHVPSNEDDGYEFQAPWINLVMLNGYIAVISFNQETTTFHISILGEISVEESWAKHLIVVTLPCVDRPIGMGTKGEIFFIRKDNQLVWVNLCTLVIKEVDFKEVCDTSRIIIYKESTQPIGGISN
jgi:F-box interacting protein